MGAFDIKALLDRLTLGKNKISAELNNLSLKGENFKVSKAEILSIFSDKEEKKIAEQYFDFINTPVSIFDTRDADLNTFTYSDIPEKTEQAPDEHIDTEEITNFATRLIVDGDLDGILDNISEKEVEQFTQIKGADVLFKIIRKLTENKDYTIDIKSGDFTINGETPTHYDVEHKKGADERTYTLKHGSKKVTATFGGPDAILQVMTSSFYSFLFENPDLSVDYVVSPDNETGSTWTKVNLDRLDKSKKLGMDAFLGNTEGLQNFAGAFDIDSNNQKKSFTFIPDEFGELIDKNNYSKMQFINALKTISNLKDEDDIISTLATFDYKEQYEDVLLKRKKFFKTMYEIAQKEPQNDNISTKEFFENIKNKALEQTLSKTSDIRDLISFQKSVDKIEDIDTKLKLQELLVNKKVEINLQREIQPLGPLSKEQILNRLAEFGFAKEDNKDIENYGLIEKDLSKIIRQLNDTEISAIQTKYGEDADAILSNMQLPTYTESIINYINNIRNQGIDILKNKETFDKFYIVGKMMHDTSGEGKRVYPAEIYDVIMNSFDTPKTNPEKSALAVYKSEDFWQINNALTTQRKENKEPLPKASWYIDSLTKYLNRMSTPSDIKLYRGEGFQIFNTIRLENGEQLGNVLQDIDLSVSLKGITPDMAEKIKKLTSEIQDNNYTATQERFLSCSADEQIAREFGSLSLIVNLPAGSKASCIDATYVTDDNTSEAEILCQRGSTVKITDIKYDGKENRWQVFADVVTN